MEAVDWVHSWDALDKHVREVGRKASPNADHVTLALQTCRDSVPLGLLAGQFFLAQKFILNLIKRD